MATDGPLDVSFDCLWIDPDSARWPNVLENIESPPAELWLRGRPELLEHTPRVAIVGSRAPSPYGVAQSERFARALAEAGVAIVSGLARGVDAAAHDAALDAGGPTLAVLGCGVDQPWPKGPTTQRVLADGLLLSEYRPGTSPRRHHFPMRNRLISGLASVVVVIEAAHASGSLITARWAADQGRDVFAVPGRVDHPMSRGCHRLLREGASLAEGPEEVLEELGLSLPPGTGKPERTAPGGEQAKLLGALTGETLSASELAERVGRELSSVLTALVELELAGFVRRGPGGLYQCRPP